MEVRRIILAAAVVGVLGLVVYLFVQVSAGDAGAEVSADKKAKALAEYERQSKLTAAEVPDPDPIAPTKRGPREPARPPARPMEREDQVFEKQPRERPNTERPGRAALSMRQPSISLSAGGGGDDPELKKRMSEVSAAYDSGDYPTAHDLAIEVLKDSPRNIRMLRVVVSTSCSQGDGDLARSYAQRLPERDRNQMASRCQRWGIDL